MINIQDLSFSYKKKAVFDGLSLQFEPGRIYGLLGRNGSGKSSLLRNIAGLLRPKNGQLTVNGFTPFERQPIFLESVFLVPEEFYLPDLPIATFVKINAPFYSRFDESLFDKYIADFEIPAGSTLQHMSYGQKKKVLIAFALATRVNVLLMDEPTNGLDIVSKTSFRKLLAASMNDEQCIIISTHQVKDLEHLIDHITIMEEGSVLFDKGIEQIAQKLTFQFTYDAAKAEEALYSEPTLMGNVIVTENTGDAESNMDIELLYKAIVSNHTAITKLF